MANKIAKKAKTKSKLKPAKKSRVQVMSADSEPLEADSIIDISSTKAAKSSKPARKPVKNSQSLVVKSTESLPSLTEKALQSNDPLVTYLNEIRKYPLLTPDEEYDLAIEYKEKGNKQAAEKLVTSNL